MYVLCLLTWWTWCCGHPSRCCSSVWYFHLQLLLCRSRYVGRGGDGARLLWTDCLCNAVKGKICHALWTQFAVQPHMKFHSAMQSSVNVHTLRAPFPSAVKGKALSWAVSWLFSCAVCCTQIQTKVLNPWWVCCLGRTMITAEISAFVNQVNSLCPVMGQH